MIDALSKLVEENAQQAIVQNKSIPDQFNNAAIKEVTNQIISNLKGQVAQGNMSQVISLFQSGARNINSNPLVSSMMGSVTKSLEAKFGLSPQVAQTVASNVIPTVITQVISRTNDPRNIDFDLQQMMRTMSGNSTLDITSMLTQQPKGALGSIGNVFGKLFGK